LSLVIDSSITLAWHFKDEQTAQSRAVLKQVVEAGAIVPALWRFEIANALLMAVRRKRIDHGFRDRALAHLGTLAIITDRESEEQAWKASVRLAERHGLTVYDAAYLELAQRRRLPLATLDAALVRAAGAELTTVLGPD
jgi:predicted nucleic acid-binding protein